MTAQGYGLFLLHGKVERAHRAGYKILRGEIPDSKILCHKCNVKSCVNPDHLYPGDKKSNANDFWRTDPRCEEVRVGMSKKRKGWKNPHAKFVDGEILEMYRRANAGESGASIARSFGTAKEVVNSILRGASWKHLFHLRAIHAR